MSGSHQPISLKLVFESALALALVLGALMFFENVLTLDFHRTTLFGLGFIIVSGLAAGRFGSILGLPSLTGYLFAGLICGPTFLHIVSEDQVNKLKLINGLALALIAMQAGCEFTKEMLFSNFKLLLAASVSHLVVIGIGMAGIFFAAASYLPGLNEIAAGVLLPLAFVISIVGVSKSPAAVMAILGETKIKNRLSEHAIGMVVFLDVFVIIVFAVALAYARSAVQGLSGISLHQMSELIGELVASIAAGTFFGLFISMYFWLIDRERTLFLILISFGVTALCSYLHYETLLVFVVAGFTVTNFSQQAEKMISVIESLSSVVMIVFFATAGASLHVMDLIDTWQLVAILFLGRLGLTWLSEKIVHTSLNSPAELKAYGYTPFLSQAGLSIGLAVIAYDRIPTYGSQVATIIISVVTLNEIFGPLLFKWGLQKSANLQRS